MPATWKPGTLIAVTGIFDYSKICRIARIVEDRGKTVIVDTDEQIENEAALEYDLPNFEQERLEVERYRIRPILES